MESFTQPIWSLLETSNFGLKSVHHIHSGRGLGRQNQTSWMHAVTKSTTSQKHLNKKYIYVYGVVEVKGFTANICKLSHYSKEVM